MTAKICPSCGAQARETYYVCRACGDDYVGGAMAKVLDAATGELRAEVDRLTREREDYREKRANESNSLRLLVRQLALALDAWADAKDDQELLGLLEKAREMAGK